MGFIRCESEENRQDAKSAKRAVVYGSAQQLDTWTGLIQMDEPDKELDELASRVVDAAIEVHRELGPGFLENLYEQALLIELETRGIPCETQIEVPLRYKGKDIGSGRVDMLVGKRLILELKSVNALLPVHTAQVLSYLKATNLNLDLLLNFNVKLMRDGIRRVVLNR